MLLHLFATIIAVTSLFFNAFFTCVFILNVSLRKSPLYYFGILAVLDTIMAVNYLALMAVPVYMDQFKWLWLYPIFLTYLRPMLTLSNCAMFASVLLILLATVERLLRTFNSEKLASLRRFLERRRPQVCLGFIFLAISYKMCTYFEIYYVEHINCTDWDRFEIVPTKLAQNPVYKFWWMFVARNLIDRFIPFFVLVFMNFLIIRTLKKEHLRSSKAGVELVHYSTVESNTKLLKRTFSINNGSEDHSNKKNLRDATRALTAIVSMYLMSQMLQVLIAFWEAFWKGTLENEFVIPIYSYLNDLVSILTLLSSALRFPVYCAISGPIKTAARDTLLLLYHHTVKPAKVSTNYNNNNEDEEPVLTRDHNHNAQKETAKNGSAKLVVNGHQSSQPPRLVRLATPEEIAPLSYQRIPAADQFSMQERIVCEKGFQNSRLAGKGRLPRN
uniref:G-protein coupled receptors family 1 profile domain-containing protein n=1 Tax=Ditylenchus dipsaci TaxID=166011 RepID=A0A915CN43_9BILA